MLLPSTLIGQIGGPMLPSRHQECWQNSQCVLKLKLIFICVFRLSMPPNGNAPNTCHLVSILLKASYVSLTSTLYSSKTYWMRKTLSAPKASKSGGLMTFPFTTWRPLGSEFNVISSRRGDRFIQLQPTPHLFYRHKESLGQKRIH